MTLLLVLIRLCFGLPDLGTTTGPSGIQLNGNVKTAKIERPRL